ncbi:RING-type E3 ubiquitin transferase [Quillaja saponaria]|uniref:RING-type E3 ubiquitin transferase n=1 Tax=Quillaja saponaria TaxID=32244 RepID=A0AAD7LGK2_QUISA|nr:RING-type E3 ubiquitin transferase [Quillaja saponaria]
MCAFTEAYLFEISHIRYYTLIRLRKELCWMAIAGTSELRNIKVHHLMCLELQKFIDRISQILPAIESSRPRCSLGMQALCSLQVALDKAKLLIQHCSESSKLYLAITADRIVLRCEKIRNALELCLSQLQNMAPSSLAAKIAGVVHDLKSLEFSVEYAEDEAGKLILKLLQKDSPTSDSTKCAELEALQNVAFMLKITSHSALVMEKRSIKLLVEKLHDTDQLKKILKYLLYLLRKYGEFIRQL